MDIFITRWIAFDDVLGRTLPKASAEPSRETDPLAHAASTAVQHLLSDTSRDACRDMGLIIGTTLGSLEQDRRFDESRRPEDGRYASPATFTRTLPSTIASELTIWYGIGGPTLVVSAGGASAMLAVARACAWMQHLGLENCMAGGLEWLGPGVADETGSADGDRCRGILCLLSRSPAPEAIKIVHAGISASGLRCTMFAGANMWELIDALDLGSAGEITVHSGDGMAVSLVFGDR